MSSVILERVPSEVYFQQKVKLHMTVGKFLIKTLETHEELAGAFALRYQVFQVESVGLTHALGFDQDAYDLAADHLAIFELKSGKMIATCRLNSSRFVNRFYSEQEFQCEALLNRPETKLEIGRVCVDLAHRKGAVILILWRAIAEYMILTQTEILFGCGSVMTEDPKEARLLFEYLKTEQKVRLSDSIFPIGKYRFAEFEALLDEKASEKLTEHDLSQAKRLLPSLCRSYFDIGCYVACAPAIDREFKCIDFLTVLEAKDLSPGLRRKMFGS